MSFVGHNDEKLEAVRTHDNIEHSVKKSMTDLHQEIKAVIDEAKRQDSPPRVLSGGVSSKKVGSPMVRH